LESNRAIRDGVSEGARVSTVLGDVISMWLFQNRRSKKFEVAASGSLRLFGDSAELNDHRDSPEVA
jgi:hypothetical protein